MTVLSKGSLFDPELVSDLVTKVTGKSSLALLAPQVPVGFNGRKEFVFNFDGDVDVVAENGKKSHGGMSLEPVTIIPVKVEYGSRVSDEFMYASEEEQLDILTAFNDGFAKKLAAGLDKMAMHGINPRTGTASSVIGTNHFDSMVTQTVTYAAATADDKLEDAIALVEGSDGEVTGMAISPALRQALAKKTDSQGNKVYPEFAFGGKPTSLGTNQLDINKTVSAGSVDEAIVGDFANMFKWGYGKEISLEVIEYGDPDNTNVDLKGSNQVYIRAEAYIGWAIFNPASFARVVD